MSSIKSIIKRNFKSFDRLYKLFYNLEFDDDAQQYIADFTDILIEKSEKLILSEEQINHLLIVLITKDLVIMKSEGSTDKSISSMFDEHVYGLEAKKITFDKKQKEQILTNISRGTYFSKTKTSRARIEKKLADDTKQFDRKVHDTIIIKKDFQKKLPAEEYVTSVLINKIIQILIIKTSEQKRIGLINEVLNTIPDIHKTDETLGWLFLEFQKVILENKETKDVLNTTAEKNIVAEIVLRHLTLLYIGKGKDAYKVQFKKYADGTYKSVDADTLSKIEIRISALSVTSSRLSFVPTSKYKTKHSKTILLNSKLSLEETYYAIIRKLNLSVSKFFGESRLDANYPYLHGYKPYIAKLEKIKSIAKHKTIKFILTPSDGTTWKQIEEESGLLFFCTIVSPEFIDFEEMKQEQGTIGTIQSDIKDDSAAKIADKEAKELEAKIDLFAQEIITDVQYFEYASIHLKYDPDTKKFDKEYFPFEESKESFIPLYLKDSIKEILYRIERSSYKNPFESTYYFDGRLSNDSMEEYDQKSDNDDEIIEIPFQEDCLSLLDNGQEHLFADCVQTENKFYAEQIRTTTAQIGSILSDIAEILNPADPKNLATLGFLKAITIAPKIVKAGITFKKISYGTTFIPLVFARWGVKGTDFINKAIKDRRLIRKAIKAARNIDAHHRIPIEALKKTKAVQAALLGGFNINSKINAKAIPKILHSLLHETKYNKWVLEEIRNWEKLQKFKFTKEAAREFIEKELIPKADNLIDGLLLSNPSIK